MEAVNCNNREIVKNMLLKGVDRNQLNKANFKAIDIARQANRQEIVKILNEDFTLGQKIAIACNVRIVYKV